jgi:hypothetical protein
MWYMSVIPTTGEVELGVALSKASTLGKSLRLSEKET